MSTKEERDAKVSELEHRIKLSIIKNLIMPNGKILNRCTTEELDTLTLTPRDILRLNGGFDE